MKRIFLISLVLLAVLLVAFILFGTSANLTENEYNTLKRYDTNFQSLPGDTLTVMTYNVGYLSGMTNNLPVERNADLFEENLDKIIGLMKSLEPDITGFQEIDFASQRSYYQNQLDSIAMKTGYPLAYKSVNWDRRYVPFPFWPLNKHFGQVQSGQAILSAYPVDNTEMIRLIKPVNTSFLYNSFYLERLIQLCDVQIGDQTVKVMNLHLEAFDEETRVLQAKIVRELYESYVDKMPVLLMGDFNSRNRQEDTLQEAMDVIMQARHIASAVSDSIYLRNPKDYYTFDSRSPYQMIDYILYNENFITGVTVDVIQEAREISDHLPVLFKFVLRPENE